MPTFLQSRLTLGISAGIALIVATLAIMIGYKHQHLQWDFPLWIYPVLAVLALFTLWSLGRRDAWRPPVLHSVIAALFFVIGIAMAAQPVTVFLNGLGVASDRTQTFVVRAGSLEPIGNRTGIRPIDFPGTQSRLAWLKDGTIVKLAIKQGRFGLWEYDDTPLRQLADEQGIQ